MVSGSEVKVIYPSVSFFFARLGAALGFSSDFLLLVRDFVFAGLWFKFGYRRVVSDFGSVPCLV